ncbi:hypothetical protein [Novosphingobium sp. 9U]|uniref:hypothetical protein n=1 Tax=Novosphingobium sp. 9U TaxID=2653158 RepID=UPI001357521C|nr:hypothetical protein [Novosphingobium sp. 9U]
MDTGEIDYRRAEPLEAPAVARRLLDYRTECAREQGFSGVVSATSRETPCVPLLGSALVRQNVGGQQAIRAGDVYSIRLEHGLVAFLTEPGISVRRLASGKSVRRAVGEIVVLASSFEFSSTGGSAEEAGDGGGNATVPTVVRFSDMTDLAQTKVIYYGPDVEEGQDLNFSNIPIQAPTRYGGNPIGIQLIVLELDRMSSQMQSLLKRLAGLGQASNLVPGGQAGSVLLELGTSLLTQDNDDTIFEYRFVLDPSDGRLGTVSAPFEAGRYVLRRSDERRDDQNWRNLQLDLNTGKLVRTVPGTGRPGEGEADGVVGRPFTEDTYFTINIVKHAPGTLPSSYAHQSFAELGENIASAAGRRDQSLAEVTAALERKTIAIRSRAWAADLSVAWTAVEGAGHDYARLVLPPAGCPAATPNELRDLERRRDVARLGLRSSALRFARLYRSAAEDEGGGAGAEVPVFPAGEREAVLARMASLFTPLAGGGVTATQLTDSAAFESAWTGTDLQPFVEEVVAAAGRNWAPPDCDSMKASGLVG